MNTSENPLKKTLVSNPSSSFSYISISSFPDFLHPEKEIQNKEIYELFLYLTQTINWPYYSFLDIFKRQNNIPKDMNFKIWENNKCIKNFYGHKHSIRTLCKISEEEFASGSFDGTIKIWDINYMDAIETLIGHSSYVISVIKISNGDLISCSNDHSIKIWRK